MLNQGKGWMLASCVFLTACSTSPTAPAPRFSAPQTGESQSAAPAAESPLTSPRTGASQPAPHPAAEGPRALHNHSGTGSPAAPGASAPPATSGPASAFAKYYPDLTAVPADTFFIQQANGTSLLRFPGIIANTGEGHMQVRSTRVGEVTSAAQEILDPQERVVETKDVGSFVFHEGHGHSHVTTVAKYELRKDSPTGPLLKVAPKVSFCLSDTLQYQTSPEVSRYKKCGETIQGITRTYADRYESTLPDQELDVTGLPAGEYFFVIVVDPENKFLDATRTNNMGWSRIYIDAQGGKTWVKETSEP